jgi:hypothetical protein
MHRFGEPEAYGFFTRRASSGAESVGRSHSSVLSGESELWADYGLHGPGRRWRGASSGPEGGMNCEIRQAGHRYSLRSGSFTGSFAGTDASGAFNSTAHSAFFRISSTGSAMGGSQGAGPAISGEEMFLHQLHEVAVFLDSAFQVSTVSSVILRTLLCRQIALVDFNSLDAKHRVSVLCLRSLNIPGLALLQHSNFLFFGFRDHLT